MVPYSVFLLCSGVFFTAAERIWPRQRQAVNRPGFTLDVFYAFLNSEVVGSLVAIWFTGLYAGTHLQSWREPLGVNYLMRQPEWVQLLALLTVKDFLQW